MRIYVPTLCDSYSKFVRSLCWCTFVLNMLNLHDYFNAYLTNRFYINAKSVHDYEAKVDSRHCNIKLLH